MKFDESLLPLIAFVRNLSRCYYDLVNSSFAIFPRLACLPSRLRPRPFEFRAEIQHIN
jgi:hypothetical protein